MAGKIMQDRQTDEYLEILKRLQSFYKKDQSVKILQGFILSLAIIGLGWLAVLITNDLLKPDRIWRILSFYFLILFSFLVLIKFLIYPLILAISRSKNERLRHAEKQIRLKFPDIHDTLINLLELGEMEWDREDISLLRAGISERKFRLNPINFFAAIPYRKMIKPLVLLFGALTIYVILLAGVPDMMKSAYSRTVHYNQDFDQKAAIQISILNDSLSVSMGDDLDLNIRVENNVDDDPLFIKLGETLHPVNGEGRDYTYRFSSLNGAISFTLQIDEIETSAYRIEVLPNPDMSRMEIQVFPPNYTGLEPMLYLDQGDLLIAQGSDVRWKISYVHSDNVALVYGRDSVSKKDDSPAIFTRNITKSGLYKVYLMNNRLLKPAWYDYKVEVIPDAWPEIEVSEEADSMLSRQVFFQARVADDYGFSKMEYVVRRSSDLDTLFLDTLSVKGSFSKMVYYGSDFDALGFAGEDIEYFFTIWDNDEVNGFKKSTSQIFRRKILDPSEVFRNNREKGRELGEKVSESKEMISELREKVGDMMNKQLMDQKDDWEIRNSLQEVTEMRDLLEEMIDNIRNDNRQLNESDGSKNKQLQSIMEKQQQIEELFEKLMDEELKQLLEEFERLADEMNTQEQIKKTEQLKDALENLERQLDVNLELLQKLEMAKEMFDISDQMDKLGESLTGEEEKGTEDIEEITEKFEELDQRFQEQLDKNQELKRPENIQDLKKDRDAMREKLKNIGKEDKENRKEDQNEAGEQMEDLAEKIKTEAGGGGGSNPIDLETIRQITRQLNDYSFKQEELLVKLGNYNARSRQFQETGIEQLQLELKFSTIRDSLVSLGYQQPMIAMLLNDELFHVETSIKNLNRSVQETMVSQVRLEQQRIMQGANELAARLDELLDNIQAASGQGQGQENFTDSNPKDGGEEISEMKNMQESLKEQMKKMIQQMRQGQQGGEGSEQLVKMLSEREQLRRALEELRNSGKVGDDAKKKLDDVQNMMEEVEKDIIYNRLGDHTIQKEEWIQTRLLEAEEAEKEREEDNIRKSTEFKGEFGEEENPEWEDFIKEKSKSERSMNFQEIKLKQYYREKYMEYLKKLNKEKNGNQLPLR